MPAPDILKIPSSRCWDFIDKNSWCAENNPQTRDVPKESIFELELWCSGWIKLSEERYESLLNDLMEAGLEAWQNNARQTVLSEIFRDFNPLDTAVYTYWLNFAQRIGFLGSGQKQVLLVRADAAKLSEQEQIYFQQSIVENKRDGGGCDETLDAF